MHQTLTHRRAEAILLRFRLGRCPRLLLARRRSWRRQLGRCRAGLGAQAGFEAPQWERRQPKQIAKHLPMSRLSFTSALAAALSRRWVQRRSHGRNLNGDPGCQSGPGRERRSIGAVQAPPA